MSLNVKKLEWQIEQAGNSLPNTVRKRDGSLAKFDPVRIEKAVGRCFDSLETPPTTDPVQVAESVSKALAVRHAGTGEVPTVEAVQDLVEFVLQTQGEYAAAKAYILYREKHSEERNLNREVPDFVREAFNADSLYFPDEAGRFMFYDKYSRFNWDLERRETWPETVDRVIDYYTWLIEEHQGHLTQMWVDVLNRLRQAILTQRNMPSMRALAMAGDAAKRNSLAIYNCSALPAKDIQAFVEALLLSMAGCGVGFSVERENVENFPRIKRQKHVDPEYHLVEDTTEGWGEALRVGLTAWWEGRDVEFDYSQVRPKGAPLKIKGGRASGPDPLKNTLNFCRDKILSRQGSFLRTIDAHDMMCSIGQAAVSGGVRRTAMISLFDWDDEDIRTCKNGPWGSWPEIRQNANNSAVWPEGITDVQIMEQMLEMVKGYSGEPGIFSRDNINRTKPKRRKKAKWLTNPCGEIALRPFGLCNLSQAICRPDDTVADLYDKVEVATIIGTIQSLATNFPGMREEWVKNAQEERLLGVALDAQADCPLTSETTEEGRKLRDELKAHVIRVNEVYAEYLGINASAATTCNKPAGNSAETFNCASGIGKRKYPFYRRNMRVAGTSPQFKVLRASGVDLRPENGQTVENAETWVIPFPKKSPDFVTKFISDCNAVEQLEFWLMNKEHWTEHNPSITIEYSEDEVIDMIAWVVKHKDRIGGLSFLPRSNTVYSQLPFEQVTEEEYEQMVSEFPKVDWALLYSYEIEDMTTAAQELACMGGACTV